MMQDWNAYRGMLMERVGEYAQRNPAVMQALGALDAVVDQGGHLTPKVHELIALNAGAALTYSARVLDAHAQLPKQ